MTATPMTRGFMKGKLQDLGVTCYCMRCNSRYRANSRLKFGLIAWLGPLGRWIWWKSTSLEITLTAP